MNSDQLYIAATDETPEVNFSLLTGNSFMVGRSLPENAHEFYRPIIHWVNTNGIRIDKPSELELRFDYFNSSSGRFLFELLSVLERNPKRGLMTVVWAVESGDELMIEKGRELMSLLDLNFEIREF